MESTKPLKLLRAEEVVTITGWSRAKVYAMAASGDLPALKAGRTVRIPLAALESWIERNTTGRRNPVMGKPVDIWMPLYIGDYLASTQQLSAEESGAYLHLLMHEWKVGPLPLDIEILRRIARVDRDTWGTVWAMLEHFFTRGELGFTQKRLEAEKVKSREMQARASEKGQKAAEKRWEKQGQSKGNAQALRDEYPSPSPLSSVKKRQQPSRGKREADPRHAEFRAVAAAYWESRNVISMPWDGGEAKQLASLLSANPAMGVATFRELLRMRYQSTVNHADRPRSWLAKVTDYAGGPLNEFNKPKGRKSGDHKNFGRS